MKTFFTFCLLLQTYLLSAQLKFETKFYDAVNKWVLLDSNDSDNDHILGFIYIDPTAGYTLRYYGLVIQQSTSLKLKTKSDESLIIHRLANNTSDVYVLNDKELNTLNLKSEPDNFEHYKINNPNLFLLKQGSFLNGLQLSKAALKPLEELYLKDKNFELIKQKYGKNETMYFESEVQQLAFKLADKLDHKKLFAFDYILNEPNDTLMIAIQKANQTDLMNEIQSDFGEYGQTLISKFQQEKSIKNLLLFLNSKDLEYKLNSGYISLFNKVGGKEDFSGAYFVSERFRRNLYMYSLIQKQIEKTNERILVIVGSQHSAGFKDFIRDDKNIEEVNLETILK